MAYWGIIYSEMNHIIKFIVEDKYDTVISASQNTKTTIFLWFIFYPRIYKYDWSAIAIYMYIRVDKFKCTMFNIKWLEKCLFTAGHYFDWL